MRTRTRSYCMTSISSAEKIVQPVGGTSKSYAYRETAGASTYTSTITDRMGRGRINPCLHKRTSAEFLPCEDTVRWSIRTAYQTIHYTAIFRCVGTRGYAGQRWYIPPLGKYSVEPDWFVAMENLFSYAANEVVGDIQSLDTLVSLPQTLKMARSISRRLSRYVPTLGKTLLTLSDLYLSYQFGIRQLGIDITSFFEAILNMDRRVQAAQRYSGQWRRVRASAPVKVSGTSAPRPKPLANLSQTWVHTDVTDYRATVQASFFTEVKSNLTGRYWAGALGLENIPRAAWEAIPLSFVVDWFSNISGMLDRIPAYREARQLSHIIAWRDACYSLKYTVDTNCEFSPNYNDIWGFGQQMSGDGISGSPAYQSQVCSTFKPISRRRLVYYQREAGFPRFLPTKEYWLEGGRARYSVRQAVTGGALLTLWLERK